MTSNKRESINQVERKIVAEDIKYLWIDNKRCRDLWPSSTHDTGIFPISLQDWNVCTSELFRIQ